MFLGFLLKFLGGGVIQSLITARQNELASANATRKIQLQGEIATLQAEQDRRKLQVELQIAEDRYWLLRVGKGSLMALVGFYWSARIGARLFGLDDFHVVVKSLDSEEMVISQMVLAYWFISSTVKQVVGR